MLSFLIDNDMRALLNRIVAAVRDLGWNIVVLVLRDSTTLTTYPVAVAAMDPNIQSSLLTTPPRPFQESHWRQDRFCISRSYFVDHHIQEGIGILKDEAGLIVYHVDLGPRADDEWHSDDFLITPLMINDEEVGWISVDDPEDRQRPTLARVKMLEIFADQAALTMEQAELHFEVRRQMARQTVLNELAQTITQHLEMIELFPSVTYQIEQMFSYERISITLRDDQLRRARIFVEDIRKEITPEQRDSPSPLEAIAFQTIIEQRQPNRIVPDVAQAMELDAEAELLAEGFHSYVCLPLSIWGRVIGVLSMAAETADAFKAAEEPFLMQIAEHVGSSVWNALLHEVEQKRRHIADTLVQLARIINSTLDLDQVLARALEQLKRVIEFDTSTVLMPEGDSLRIVACWGFEHPETLLGATFRVEENNISHQVMRAQQVRVVDDVQKLPEWGHDRDDLEGYKKIRSWIGAPLVIRDQSIGLLVLDNFEPEAYTEEDGETVEAFATQIAIAIYNARLYSALQQQRNRLESILTDTTDAIIVLDENSTIWLLNPAARRNLKVQDEHVEGQPLSVLNLAELNAAVEDAQKTGEPTTGEITLADGTTFRASIAPVHEFGWVIVMQDITPLKELDRLRTEWVAAVSHDLKNPIQVIQLGAALLEIDGPLNALQLQRVSIIQRGTQQLSNLVSGVLDLARLEAGPSLSLEVINPRDLIQSIMAEIEHLATKKDQQLLSHVTPHLPLFYGDSALLQRAIVNLLSNAIKYTADGGTITLRISATNNQVQFEVADNGQGIPPESLPHLFDRFYRVPDTEAEGSGLGLSIVKSIVEKHNGNIQVASIEGQGSTFTVTLPIAGASAAPEQG